MATGLLPIVHEVAILNINHDRAHLLRVLADNFLLLCILVQQLCHCDMRTEEIFVDGVLVLLEGLSTNGWLLLCRCVLEIAVLDVAVAG